MRNHSCDPVAFRSAPTLLRWRVVFYQLPRYGAIAYFLTWWIVFSFCIHVIFSCFLWLTAENGMWIWNLSQKWSLELQQQGAVSLCLSLYFTCSESLIPFVVQEFVEPTKIQRWVVVNFSARCNVRQVVDDLIKIGGSKGIVSRILFFCF